MPEVPRYYWDACVFLSWVNGNPDRLPDIDTFLDEAEREEIEIIASTVSIAEVAFGKVEQDQKALTAEIDAKIGGLWEPSSPVKLVEVSVLVVEEAKGLIREGIPEGWSLKPMDAIHLSTARRMEVDVFHTYDGPLKKWTSKVGYPIGEPSPSSPRLL